jgi:hypothetical protein
MTDFRLHSVAVGTGGNTTPVPTIQRLDHKPLFYRGNVALKYIRCPFGDITITTIKTFTFL